MIRRMHPRSSRRHRRPGGTITFQVFDVHRYVIATDDSGTTEINSTEGEAALNNNMVPDASETGHGDGEGRQQ
jgi:hypothetical protein